LIARIEILLVAVRRRAEVVGVLVAGAVAIARIAAWDTLVGDNGARHYR